eukprot:TRINITY_DN4913_c0_g1_i4.p2 TRINITY_DN4913_c0_g1~~TRINITY_DN4913_c0_g1_i4.p2  ORF type:complete len:257 (-),score=23.07 TRINITY_DN4913_c0_g1_i4:237-1007(-)
MIYGYQFLKVEEVCVQRGGSIGAQSITIDRDNCYYYTDKNSATIHRCCNNTEFEIYSGKTDEEGFQNGNVKQARYKHPTSIVYCGYDQYEGLYVADNKCIIRFINREDQVSTYLGSSDLSCGSQDNGTQIKLTQVSSLACDAGEGFLVIMNAGSAETFKVQVGTPPKPPSPATPGQIVKSPTKVEDELPIQPQTTNKKNSNDVVNNSQLEKLDSVDQTKKLQGVKKYDMFDDLFLEQKMTMKNEVKFRNKHMGNQE